MGSLGGTSWGRECCFSYSPVKDDKIFLLPETAYGLSPHKLDIPTGIVMKRIVEIVAGRNVRDALIRNGYKKSAFIYVPDLVLQTTIKTAAEQ